jgi:predicted transcriptional regulator of viral defense system
VRLIGGNIYHNESKHVGAVLSNMVKRGMIRRVSPGVFALPEQPKPEAFTLESK